MALKVDKDRQTLTVLCFETTVTSALSFYPVYLTVGAINVVFHQQTPQQADAEHNKSNFSVLSTQLQVNVLVPNINPPEYSSFCF